MFEYKFADEFELEYVDVKSWYTSMLEHLCNLYT